MKVNFFWFRRDLRLEDNAGLFHALNSSLPVVPLFIFDRDILDKLEDKDDARVTFLHDTITELQDRLKELDSTMVVRYGKPHEVWDQLLDEFDVQAVFTNRDYEPYAHERDGQIETLFKEHNVDFHTFKDHVIFEEKEVVKDDGDPYTVFTPYSKKWKAKLDEKGRDNGGSHYFQSFPTADHHSNFWQSEPLPVPSLEDMSFVRSSLTFPDKSVRQGLIKNYDKTRNFPGIEGTSRLGVHFRFGTISIREKARKAQKLNATFLNELIWRDFYAMILANFPYVKDRSFRKKYDYIEWRNDEEEFQRWCKGQTGYPIVDAGMRELNATGYMHNRVRMITASFLTKHLLIDWRWGEAYFARKLLDYELASNNGGWQWAAGSGTDAAPYFRIFNPYSQQQKFDKDFKYIKKWVPEYDTDEYVAPIVEHKAARERCLETYKAGLERADQEMVS